MRGRQSWRPIGGRSRRPAAVPRAYEVGNNLRGCAEAATAARSRAWIPAGRAAAATGPEWVGVVETTRQQSRRPATDASRPERAHDLFLGRQPILDAAGRLQAFELLFRSGQQNQAVVPNDLTATAQVLHYVFAELGIEKALGPYRGFINCDEKLLLEPGLLDAMPCDKLVLEILETVAPSPAILQRCRALQAAGFELALDDYTGGTRPGELLALVDIIKVDVLSMPAPEVQRVVASLSGCRATLLAEKIQTREQAEECKALGFALFQGYFFARPTVIQGHRLRQSQLALLRVMALLLQNAEVPELEQVFKQEPGLSLNLLKIVNSVGTGLRSPVTSLAHAIAIVGQRPLLRWMQLLLYADDAGDTAASPLLHLAATRGRLMELLAQDLWPQHAERSGAAFMVGMMSLVPTLLNTPLAEILATLPLPTDVSAALLRHEGCLGPLLVSVEALEGTAASEPIPGLTANHVSQRLAEAMAWTHEITFVRG